MTYGYHCTCCNDIEIMGYMLAWWEVKFAVYQQFLTGQRRLIVGA